MRLVMLNFKRWLEYKNSLQLHLHTLEYKELIINIPARLLLTGHSESEFLECPLDASMSLQSHLPVHPTQILSMLLHI